MRLFLLAVLAITSSFPAVANDGCAALLKRTQAFSDAGQRGDGAAMAKMLDPHLIFFNETGEKATRADMAAATPPPSGTPIHTILTTDWDCKIYGDVAVTSFIDVLEPASSGERKFRSVETWKEVSGVWKMIGSETLTLLQDPNPVVLSGNALEEYVGSYENAPGMKFNFVRKGADLVASLNGGAETPQLAQARDIFFTPGHGATPKVFQRGDDGKIIGFIYLRGKDSIIFKRVG